MSTSQSRHFNLQWLDQPKAWLAKLDRFLPVDAPAAWRWHVSHHQLLTLAKRTEREVGLAVLWFSVSLADTPVMLGALLPGDRFAIAALAPIYRDELHQFLETRLKIKSIMGNESTLQDFGILPLKTRATIIERQTSWGKRLTTVGSPSKDYQKRNLTVTRRAGEFDRPTLNRWAQIFSSETRPDTEAEAVATTVEVAEWVRRGRLLIFETDRPVGMAAFSGEFTDRDFGRSCRLSLVFVDPVYRGRGIGHEMMAAVENEARLENVNALILYSDPANERARRFYADLEFTPSEDWLEIETGFNRSLS